MRLSDRHISVCICTYKRSKFLNKLLKSLQNQITGDVFSYSIVVVDNDYKRSGEHIVEEFKRHSPVRIGYYNEPEQNIALARNKAVANAGGEFVAFIDDDEVPCANWLINLHKACDEFQADGVLGPVLPCYEVEPPKWVVRGRLHERPTHRTGEVLHWRNTRTGNVLIRRVIFDSGGRQFKKEFGRGGEDTDFFKRMIAQGFRFVWCEEAPVYEAVTAERCTRSFMVKRALLRGRQPYFKALDYANSLVAIPLYTMALPLLLVVGHHLFMKYLIKDCDHFGRLLALCGIDIIKEKYVSPK